MVDKCFSYSKMTVFKSPTLIKRFRKWRQDITKQVFCLQVARGAGTLFTAKCSVPGTHCASNSRGLARGDARGWNWLAHYKTKKNQKIQYLSLGAASLSPLIINHWSAYFRLSVLARQMIRVLYIHQIICMWKKTATMWFKVYKTTLVAMATK